MPKPAAALVFDAHDYEPLSKTADPHGHGADCDCHPACKVCGSAEDAYIHTTEGREAGATVVVRAVAHTDKASAGERAAAG